MSKSIPSRLGRYEVQAVLGKGSMGVVYLARDPLIGRLVALKTFHPGLAADEEEMERFRSRFLREAQSAGILSHPNVVTIHDVVEESAEGATFIAMEYVQGTNLKEVLRYGKPLEMVELVEVVRQMAAALDYAHGKGVVHRDVKPANVLLTPERQVKLTDFGIARLQSSNLTHDGQLLGTPNYMSPEQVQGREVDHRTDLFSLGVIVYEMITRHKPFSGENLTAVTHRIVYERHTPLERYVGGLPEGLSAILDRALHKDPERRYPDAGELARDLEREVALHEEQVALSETQSIDDLRLAPPPDPGEDTRPGLGTTPPPPLPAGEDRPASAGSSGAAAPGAVRAPGATGEGAAGGRPRGGPVGTGGGAAALGTGGGALGGFRHWLRLQPGFGMPDWKRLSAVGLLVALVVLGGGLLLLRLLEPDLEGVAQYPPEHRVEVEYQQLLREGLRHNQAGDPLAAAAAFRRAESLKPDDPRIQRLRRVAEHRAAALQMNEVRRAQVALQVEAAAEALAADRYREALATAEVVLEVDPGNEEAARVARSARGALSREARQRQQVQRQAEELAEESTDEEEAQEEAVEATGPATLRVELETEGEGRLRVTVDGRLVADVGYQHFERVGLFRRKKPYRGVTRIPALEVEAGVHEIRYRLVPEEGEPQAGEMEVRFPAGETRVLELVHVPGSTMAAVVE